MMAINTLRTALVLVGAAWTLSAGAMTALAAPTPGMNDGTVMAQNAFPLPEPANPGEQIDQVDVDPEEDIGPLPQGQSGDFMDDEDEALTPEEILDMERTMGNRN